MKIAILTLRLHKNYGGVLQNYALAEFLKKLGHEVVTINIFWGLYPIGLRQLKNYGVRIIKKYILGKKIDVFHERKILEIDKVSTRNIVEFKRKYIPLTKKVYVIPGCDMSDINKEVDVVIVGSDQVWRPRYTRGIYRYFCDFITNPQIKKISYAASFGCDHNEYKESERKKCAQLIESFAGVSVREESAIELINEQLKWNVKAECHIDPTLLLNRGDYIKLFNNTSPNHKIFQYVLDKTYDKDFAIDKVSKLLKLESFNLLPDGLKNDDSTIIPPVEEWLKAIANSDFIITDSFHGMVFSIIFNKEFLVYVNSNRGKTRFVSLLNKLNLSQRLIENSSEITLELLNTSIDWYSVNRIIDEERIRSIEYINRCLN